jgi:cell wall-associated NlpC family hydrolase
LALLLAIAGFDGLLAFGLRLLVGLVVLALVVVLVVVQTAAGLLWGGRPVGRSASRFDVPASQPISAPRSEPTPVPRSDLGGVVQIARSWLGVPHVFGGRSRSGVDCSCLVQNVYAAAGIRLPRVAVDQFNATQPVADPQPGDLVFFANTYQPGVSHVGIYIGNGQQINAPTPGTSVAVEPVFTGYWGAHFVGARRPR